MRCPGCRFRTSERGRSSRDQLNSPAASILITWVPASINRVYGLRYPTDPSYVLNVMSAIVKISSERVLNGLPRGTRKG